VPPPMGIPKPVGVPVPPFGAKPGQAMPKVDASDPYAAISADFAPEKQEQTVKVELSREVVEAQKKGRAKIVFLAIATAVVGGLLGFTLGGRLEANKGAKAAVGGAKELVKLVETANGDAANLAEVLKSATNKLTENKYPDEEVTKLGEIHIPFEANDLYGRGMGRYQKDTQLLLVQYTAQAQAVNDAKDRLRLVLGQKKIVTDYLEQQTTPKVRWSVYVLPGAHGPWAIMQPVPEPFLATSKEKVKDKDGKEVDYKWPEKFKIREGNQTHELERYERGDPTGSKPKIIPVDPTSHEAVCPSDVKMKLLTQVGELAEVLQGTGPPHEKPGMIQLGDALLEALRKIGQP
jgi:hypothetical protein